MTKEMVKAMMEAFRQELITEEVDMLVFDGYCMTDGNVIFYFNTETGLLEGMGGD